MSDKAPLGEGGRARPREASDFASLAPSRPPAPPSYPAAAAPHLRVGSAAGRAGNRAPRAEAGGPPS